MKTKPNQIILPLSIMMKYIQLYKEQGDTLDWVKMLELEERPRVSLIEVKADNRIAELGASLGWGWRGEEIRIAKIEVNNSLRGQNIGNTMMKMLFAIAKFYDASKITGTISGDKFLWNWYQNLGFKIYDDNKLLMEIE